MTRALDRPLSMASWEEETGRDYGLVYDYLSFVFHEELSTVRKSLYEKGLQMKYTFICKSQASKDVLPRDKDGMKDREEGFCQKIVFDFATVHRERALNAGKLNKDKGRRWRRKHYSRAKRDGQLSSCIKK